MGITAVKAQPLQLDKIDITGGTQPRAAIDYQVVSDYAAAMAAGDIFPPVIVIFDGVTYWLADGFHRYHAARASGATEITVDVRTGSVRDAVLLSVGANAQHGLRRTNADKRKSVETLLADPEWRAWSDNKVARQCGVSHPFVGEVRRSLVTVRSEGRDWAAQDEAARRLDAASRTYTTKHGTVATMDTSRIGRPPIPTPDLTIVSISEDNDDGNAYCRTDPVIAAAVDIEDATGMPLEEASLVASKLAVHFRSETPEHYTPRDVIDAAIACLGGIDIDPCSNARGADANVPARDHFTREDDGLSREWHGTVYMNPPYGREVDAWVAKLIEEHRAGRVTQAIALLPARPDTQWYRRLRDYKRCEVEGRLTFIGNNDPAPFPSVIFYLGCDDAQFIYCFDEFGDIFERVECVGV